MADAWLGLHGTGTRRDESLAAIVKHESRFGEQRQREQRTLRSRFAIGTYVTYRLESHLELWCAVAAQHLKRRELSLAASALQRTAASAVPAAFLRGRLAVATGDHQEAIMCMRLPMAGTDKFLQAEAALISGAVLAQEGALHPAREQLGWVLQQKVVLQAHAEARYFLGLICRAEGDEPQAQRHFQSAYAERPRLPGLAAAMARTTTVTLGVVGAGPPATEQHEPSVKAAKRETVADILIELDGQIGQDDVKRQVRTIVAQSRAQLARQDAGLGLARLTDHFVFAGPPGTGKTTIARMIGRLYAALGILQNGHVVEVDRSGLIGKFHGHTVAQTSAKLDQARGGVLFVDEAYALQNERFDNGDPFGQEAIDTILKRMEDERDDLVVIAAGYPEPMQRFLNSNPGLRSRFTTVIDFKAYSSAELVQIAILMASSNGDVLTPSARLALGDLLARLTELGVLSKPQFGNARYARTLIEKAARHRDYRLFREEDAEVPEARVLAEIEGCDIEAAARDMDKARG